MINEEIKKYVADQRAAGFTDNQIKDALIASGWATADIMELLQPVESGAQSPTPVAPEDTKPTPEPEPETPQSAEPAAATAEPTPKEEPTENTQPKEDAAPVVPVPQANTTTQPAKKKHSVWITVLIVLVVLVALVAAAIFFIIPAALNSARAKGADTIVMSSLNNMRAQAELYFNQQTSYAGLCSDPTVQHALNSVQQASGQNPICGSDANGYLMAGTLSTGQMYCIDSSGTATTVPAVANGQTTCLPGTATTTPTAPPPTSSQPTGTTTLASSTPAAQAQTATNTPAAFFSFAQFYYAGHNNSYVGLCQEPAVQQGFTSASSGLQSKPACSATKSGYLVTLPVSPQLEYCMDNTGTATTVPTLPPNATSCISPKA